MEGNHPTGLNTGRSRCQYCYGSFPLNNVMVHEAQCLSNPANKTTQNLDRYTSGTFLAIPNSLEKLPPTPVAQNKNVPHEGGSRSIIAVIGKEKCGKSTIIDSLIGEKGVTNSTTDSENSFRSFMSRTHKKYTLIEPYGLMQNLISGLSLADCAIIVIDSAVDFRTSHPVEDFREECSIAISLGVKQMICCCNKIDAVSYSRDRYYVLKNEATTYLRSLGIKASCIPFVPTAALQNENITERTAKLKWYKGSTLLEELDKIDTSSKERKMLRMVVHNATNERSSGLITGRVHSGSLVTGSNLRFFPGTCSADVNTIRMNTKEVKMATAGELVEVEVKGLLDLSVKRGCIASYSREGLEDPVQEALAFTAQLLVIDPNARITGGMDEYLCTIQECEFMAIISSIACTSDRSTGRSNPPRVELRGGDLATVFMAPAKAGAVLEKASQHPSLGRIAVYHRYNKGVIAVGVITDVEKDLVQTFPRSAAGSSGAAGSFGAGGNRKPQKTNKKK